VSPHSGAFLSVDFQAAGGPFGGDAEDFKIQPDARVYLPIDDDLTLAVRSSVGFLFARNYGHTLAANARGERPPMGVDRVEGARAVQPTFFRAFFSGRPSSNRGYAMRGIGPHGAIPFFEPTLAAQQLADRCDGSSADLERASCQLPLGGLSLWEAS